MARLVLHCQIRSVRTQKNKHPDHYQQLLAQDRCENMIACHELPLEFLMNHLRLKQGFTTEHFQRVTGMSIEIIAPILNDCIQDHLIQKSETCLPMFSTRLVFCR
jgi:oxygen-independent coproporphyrinogen-3 oxidase